MSVICVGSKMVRSAFIRKMAASKSNAKRLSLLREVLRAQRKRHNLLLDESWSRNKKAGAKVSDLHLTAVAIKVSDLHLTAVAID